MTALLWSLSIIIAIILTLNARSFSSRKQVHRVRDRSHSHDLLLSAMDDWLSQEKIVKALVQYSGYSPEAMGALRQRIWDMDYDSVQGVAARVLENSNVRRIVASYMHEEFGADKHEIMEALLAWAKPELVAQQESVH